ncbi:hypothetical protein E1B28_001732 [Marasmius oreades]|uniref:F-box domain-containing protein n=1 Tax=Marasmius oreades TaxID=181124 RepID=A0A9P7V408_9AGAR|nr:uncharacterized protein E1B28_001732 [Marasmius oreades]KAG7099939.1 hypothetical protein E1B28_001732 [Marasmius oreades]
MYRRDKIVRFPSPLQLAMTDDVTNDAYKELLRGPHSGDASYLEPPDNSYPISRLPSEILVHIFAYLVTIRSAFMWTRPTYLDFTHVCHDWREIALNTPSLWTQPDFRWLGWVREMLRRSKDAPLHVRYRIDEMITVLSFEDAMMDILVHIHRIASLYLYLELQSGDKKGFNRTLLALDKPAPLVHTVRFGFFRALHPSNIPFPQHLFADEAPNLRNLFLDGCHFRWNSPLLKHLTTFSLRTHDRATMAPCDQCPTTKRFMEILEAMPELEVLNLDCSLPSHLSEAPDFAHTVHFPRMRDLRLVRSSVTDCTNLLQRISFPQSTTVEVSCIPLHHQNDELPLFSALSHMFASCPDSQTQTSFEKLGVESTVIGMARPTLSLKAYDSIYASFPQIKIRLSVNRPSEAPLVQPAITALPLASLQILIFTCTDCSISCFATCFGSLPNLRVIKLTQRDAVNIVLALREGLEGDGSSESSTLPFPALETLFMRDVDFGDLCHNDMFAGILVKRAERGAQLTSLQLRECIGLRSEEIDRFKEVAKEVNVDWDGYYIERDGDEDSEVEEEYECYEQQVSDYESEE